MMKILHWFSANMDFNPSIPNPEIPSSKFFNVKSQIEKTIPSAT